MEKMKTKMEKIAEKANERGLYLEVIETTDNMNGYPSNLKQAIIGFDRIEQALSLAKENNLSVQIFTKNLGWQYWYRTGHETTEPINISPELYGDNFTIIRYGQYRSERDYYEQELKPYLCNYLRLNKLIDFVLDKKEIWDEYERMYEWQVIIVRDGKYYDRVEKKTMYHSYYTKQIAIGIISNE